MDQNLANGILGGAFIVYVLAVLFFYVLLIIAEWKILAKAGEPGWMSLIPILNLYIIFKVVYGKGIKFLLLLVPLLNAVVSIALCFRLAQAFGKGVGFGFGLLFLPNIFTLILGFGSAQYEGAIDSFI